MGEIVRITERKLIASILGIQDKRLEEQVLTIRGMNKAEWVQFLENYIEHQDRIAVWGIVEDSKIKYYLVALNSIAPPISNEVALLYQNFFGAKDSDGKDYRRVLDCVREWAKGLGARQIYAFTKYPRVMSRFGFKVDAGVGVTLSLDDCSNEV